MKTISNSSEMNEFIDYWLDCDRGTVNTFMADDKEYIITFAEFSRLGPYQIWIDEGRSKKRLVAWTDSYKDFLTIGDWFFKYELKQAP